MGTGWGRARWRLAVAEPLWSLNGARASKIAGRQFSAFARRKPRACTSAKLAALKCIAAARECFLLAALHSVAERFSHRQAPAPHSHRTDHRSSLANRRGMYPLTSAEVRVARLEGGVQIREAGSLRSSPLL